MRTQFKIGMASRDGVERVQLKKHLVQISKGFQQSVNPHDPFPLLVDDKEDEPLASLFPAKVISRQAMQCPIQSRGNILQSLCAKKIIIQRGLGAMKGHLKQSKKEAKKREMKAFAITPPKVVEATFLSEGLPMPRRKSNKVF